MFYDVFLKLCNDRGITPSAACREMGINKSNITFWKNGKSNPSDLTIMKISLYFKADFEELKKGLVVYNDQPKADYIVSDSNNEQTPIIEQSSNADYQAIRSAAEFAAKYTLLTDNHKKLISDLIDTFLEDKK